MPQAVAGLMAGTNHFMFVTTLPVVQLINGDKLRALDRAARYGLSAKNRRRNRRSWRRTDGSLRRAVTR